jgi:hypothetical protein
MLGPADDQYEREADQVARQVVGQMPTQSRVVQRQYNDATGEATQHRLDMQRVSSSQDGAVEPEVQQAIDQARRDGQPLPKDMQVSIEQALGAELSGVRLHTNAQADQERKRLRRQSNVWMHLRMRRSGVM